MPPPRSRRRVLHLGVVTALLPVAGCSASSLHFGGESSQPEYLGKKSNAYEHDDLKLQLLQETVRVGDTVEFEIINTSESRVFLGCNNPWALQRQTDSEWRHATWTSEKFAQLCATLLPPGGTLTEEVPLSESELGEQADEVETELSPGQYRFVLIGTSPFLALDFTVLRSE